LAYALFSFDWNWSGAEREYHRALQLNPNYSEAHYGYALLLMTVGRNDEAIATIEGRNITVGMYQRAYQQQLMQVARRALSKYKNARISVSGGTDLSGASSAGGGRGGGGGSTNRLSMVVQGSDVEQLQVYAADLLAKVKEIDGVTDADMSFEATQPELRVDVDRQRAADLGVSMDTLSNTLRTMIGGQEVSKYKDGDDQFSVNLRLDDQFRNQASTMGDLFIPASGGRMVRVSDVATLTMGSAPGSIDRYNRMRQITVNANLDTLKITLGKGIDLAREKVGLLGLKAGYQVTFGGSAFFPAP